MTLAQLFRLKQNEFPGVNPGIINNDVNGDGPSNDAQRESDMLQMADSRAEAGIRGDLNRAEAVRSARQDHGYQGSFPLEQQEQAKEQDALARLLLPKRMELAAAQQEHETQREFTAGQNDQNRMAMGQRSNAAITGQNGRLASQQAEARARTIETKGSPRESKWRSLFGLGGLNPAVDSNATIRQQDATAARAAGNTQAASGEDTFLMESPDGSEQAQVPQSQVQAYLAKGGRLVQ